MPVVLSPLFLPSRITVETKKPLHKANNHGYLAGLHQKTHGIQMKGMIEVHAGTLIRNPVPRRVVLHGCAHEMTLSKKGEERVRALPDTNPN
jgi:hypothetical protein